MPTEQFAVTDELKEASSLLNSLKFLAIFGAIFTVFMLGLYFYKFHAALAGDSALWGQFGDFIGGVLNPTFGFLALVALLATFELQVRELRISAKELKNSADALLKQNETLRLQSFEATFFQLLHFHNESVSSIEIPQLSLKGRTCITHYLQRFEADSAGKSEIQLNDLNKHYELFYRNNQAVLGHYFRFLYHIFKFLKQSEGIDKSFYANLVRAQLSTAELTLIFYNCLSRWGYEKFKPLVEEFSLLKTIPNDNPITAQLFNCYSHTAFGGNYPFFTAKSNDQDL